jgi:hypothetical protein
LIIDPTQVNLFHCVCNKGKAYEPLILLIICHMLARSNIMGPTMHINGRWGRNFWDIVLVVELQLATRGVILWMLHMLYWKYCTNILILFFFIGPWICSRGGLQVMKLTFQRLPCIRRFKYLSWSLHYKYNYQPFEWDISLLF